MHKLGTSIQRMGPLDGNGSVQDAVAIVCGHCNMRFMVQMHGLFELGASIWNLRSPLSKRKLYCPYCGEHAHATAERMLITDTNPVGPEY